MQNQILTNNLFLYNVCSAYNSVINLRIDFTSICIIKEILNNFIYIYILQKLIVELMLIRNFSFLTMNIVNPFFLIF